MDMLIALAIAIVAMIVFRKQLDKYVVPVICSALDNFAADLREYTTQEKWIAKMEEERLEEQKMYPGFVEGVKNYRDGGKIDINGI